VKIQNPSEQMAVLYYYAVDTWQCVTLNQNFF
jgi:hypothetical protein